MAGEPEAAWVSVSLAVDEEEIGPACEALEGEGEGGNLTKGEEAGDVGEGDRALDDVLLHRIEARVGHHDGGSAGEAGASGTPASAWRIDVSHVGGGNEPDVPGVAFADDARSEPLLAGGRIGGREVPGVQVQETHAVQYTETRRGGPARLYRKYYAVIMRHQ